MKKFRLRVPIAAKLIGVTVSLLLLASFLIATNSYNLFEQTSRDREESLTESQATARADEVQGLIQTYKDKISVVASILLRQANEKDAGNETAEKQEDKTLSLAFYQDRDLVNVEVYSRNQKRIQLVDRATNEKYLKKYGKEKEYVQGLRRKFRFPIRTVFAGEFVVRNSSMKSGVPLITIAFPLVVNKYGKISHVAVADINVERIQSSFSAISATTIYLIDQAGMILAHPNEELAMERKSIKALPIVRSALERKERRYQSIYSDPKTQEKFVAAYSKTEFGPTVIAEVPENVILEPARIVQRETFFIAGLVLSGALFIVFVFSMLLTNPIEKLVELTEQISTGNFEVSAKKFVRSKDEVGELAEAFDHMTEGLRERDKVKNLFSKFHGSSVAEDLISNDVAVGGSNKEVTVFFSDIRGFTAFSETRTPEEVVEMLNEYFERMVAIINRNHGIVDKFIGDAIMAVWGAPQSTGDDAVHAAKACIEMRQSLEELNLLRIERGQPPIMIGMGLHSGRAISGTIGSEERMEYTVIGDAVNMAARIEAATKAFGTDLLISQDTANQIGEQFFMEEAGAAEVKGKSEPLKMYKVRGYIDAEGNKVTVKTKYSDFKAEKADKINVAS